MITSLYAGILAVLYMLLSIETIRARRKHRISLGYGPNNEIASIVSAHSNFSSYVFILLFLTFLVETSGQFPSWAIHMIASIFTLGRLLHYAAFRSEQMNFKWRVLGMHLTLWPLVGLGVLNIYCFIASLG